MHADFKDKHGLDFWFYVVFSIQRKFFPKIKETSKVVLGKGKFLVLKRNFQNSIRAPSFFVCVNLC